MCVPHCYTKHFSRGGLAAAAAAPVGQTTNARALTQMREPFVCVCSRVVATHAAVSLHSFTHSYERVTVCVCVRFDTSVAHAPRTMMVTILMMITKREHASTSINTNNIPFKETQSLNKSLNQIPCSRCLSHIWRMSRPGVSPSNQLQLIRR